MDVCECAAGLGFAETKGGVLHTPTSSPSCLTVSRILSKPALFNVRKAILSSV